MTSDTSELQLWIKDSWGTQRLKELYFSTPEKIEVFDELLSVAEELGLCPFPDMALALTQS